MISRVQEINFVEGWRMWFAFSGVLLLLGIGAISLGNLNFGIDFQGGAQFTAANAERQLEVGEVREALPEGVRQDAQIQIAGASGYEVRTPEVSESESAGVRDALASALGAEVSATNISPSFGEQIRNDALQALVAALLIVVVFITLRFEFLFAAAAMTALFHDMLIAVGVYALVGREVNLVTIVALLTILGYSLYDTVIIFDRIRENAPETGYVRRRFDEMVNLSVRQVVRRSIYTSISTLIPVVALLIFGDSTLADFAFALLVGILAGVYSSLFIAAPALSLLKARQDRRRKAAEAAEAANPTSS